MADVLPIPPQGTPIYDPATGALSEPWRRYYLSLENALQVDVAPRDAQYWVSTSNADLTNERNIGLLSTGYLRVTTAIGIATPSTVATIPTSDISGGAALTRTNDTNVTLTLGGSPTTALLHATSLTLGWSGLLGLARGGTNADLSATGGASQVLKQVTAGGAVTVGQLTTSDISGLPVLASGRYTPTLTNTTNLDGSTAYLCQYLRVGSTVTVSGRVDMNPTAAGAVVLGMSLPVASNFAALTDCGGTAVTDAVSGECASISADIANDRATFEFLATDTNNRRWSFAFTYTVL